jgi:Nucleoside 2-deoxyribosyltransferase
MNSFIKNIPSLRWVRGRPTRVYLCGPIAKNCWRHKLVPDLRNAFGSEDERACARHDVVTELPTITAGFVCVGPWFIGCDHGCAHGQGTHGTEGGGCLDEPLGTQDLSDVFHANIERIRRADAVFAYIDRTEAYGSAYELGAAAILGKSIFVGFPPNASWQDDMWFAAQAGLGSKRGHVGPVEVVWAKFCMTLDISLKVANWPIITALTFGGCNHGC